MTAPKVRKRLPLSVTAFLLVLGLVVALNAIHVVGRMLLAKAARKVAVEEGTITLAVSGDSVLLRRELILVAPRAGIWHPKAEAGQRLPTNTCIGEILTPDLLDRARQCQEKAAGEKTLWESQLIAQQQQMERDLAEVNRKVPALLSDLKSDLTKLETVRAQQLNTRLQELLRQRTVLLAQKEQLAREAAVGGAWRQTMAEAQKLMAQATTSIVTPLAGRFQDQLDGWEDVFDPLEYKTALTELSPIGSVVTVAVEPGSNVNQGQILGKITQEEPTFIRVSLHEKLEAVTLDDWMEVLFPKEQLEISAQVAALRNQGNEPIVVLRLQNVPPALASVRQTKVQLILSRVRGALIPEKALIRQSGQEGVYCWQREKWQFVPVEVKALDQGQAIVSGISPGDEIALGLRF